jgi:hypothetical protein
MRITADFYSWLVLQVFLDFWLRPLLLDWRYVWAKARSLAALRFVLFSTRAADSYSFWDWGLGRHHTTHTWNLNKQRRQSNHIRQSTADITPLLPLIFTVQYSNLHSALHHFFLSYLTWLAFSFTKKKGTYRLHFTSCFVNEIID